MAATRKNPDTPKPRRRPPASTPEGRENQIAALAYDAVEKKIIEGTATSQEIVHFLKVGSSREKKEQAKLALERDLLEARIETMESAKRVEELYDKAIHAMKAYAGQDQPNEVLHDD